MRSRNAILQEANDTLVMEVTSLKTAKSQLEQQQLVIANQLAIGAKDVERSSTSSDEAETSEQASSSDINSGAATASSMSPWKRGAKFIARMSGVRSPAAQTKPAPTDYLSRFAPSSVKITALSAPPSLPQPPKLSSLDQPNLISGSISSPVAEKVNALQLAQVAASSSTLVHKFGRLTLHCLYGVDLKAGKGMFGLADPYALLRIGTQEFCTNAHVDGGRNPVWHETFTFGVTVSSNQQPYVMNVEVFDKQTVGVDKFMGRCVVALDKWISSGRFDGDLQLLDRMDRSVGRIAISARIERRTSIPDTSDSNHNKLNTSNAQSTNNTNNNTSSTSSNVSRDDSYVVYRNKKSRKWILGNVVRSESDTTSVVRNTAGVELTLANSDLIHIQGAIVFTDDEGFAVKLAKLIQGDFHFHADTLEVVLVNKIKETL
eukprot:gene25402-31860_t